VLRRFPAPNHPQDKHAVKGSQRGLTILTGWRDGAGPLFITEGASDTLAMRAAGVQAVVGCPSASGKSKFLPDLLKDWPRDREIFIVADRDVQSNNDGVGERAAPQLAAELRSSLGREIRIGFPPDEAKDVRTWLTSPELQETPWSDRGLRLIEHFQTTSIIAQDSVIPKASNSAVKPYQPFPVEALPPGLREFVIEVAASINTDPAYVALPALTVAGTSIGASIVARPKRKWREAPALWTCMVGDSGTGKSPAMEALGHIVFTMDNRLKDRYKGQYATFCQDMQAYKKAEEPDPSKKPIPPIRESFVAVDITIEALAELVSKSLRGIVLWQDELAGWFNSFTRYKANGGSDLPNWLSMHNVGPIRVHRRTGEPREIEIDRAFVSVCGGIQPAILREKLAQDNLTTSGFTARLLFAMPPKLCPRYSEAEVSEETECRFLAICEDLHERPFNPKDGPAELSLDNNAKARFVALYNEFSAQSEELDGGPMSAVLPKAVKFALRLALIHFCVKCADRKLDPAKGIIDDESMAAGEQLAKWFVAESDRVFASLTENETDRDLRRLREWIQQKHPQGVTARTVQRSLSRYSTAELAESALQALVTAGHGSWQQQASLAKSGRSPNRLFVPNRSTDKTPARGSKQPINEEDSEVSSVLSVSVPETSPVPKKRRFTPSETPKKAPQGGGS
jgi:hypothetical protein